MKTRKWFVGLLVVGMLVSVFLTGCAPAAEPENEDGPFDVAVIVKATDSDFWQSMIIGAENAGKENPEMVRVTTYGPPSEADIDEQVSILEDVIAKRPDAIVIASTSSEATVPAIERAYDQGIIIITVDNRVKTDKVHSFLATDNIKGGGSAAEQLVENLEAAGMPLEGKVGIISAMAGVQVLIDRDSGFTTRLTELAPNLELIETRHVNNDMSLAMAAAEDIITANPDLVGIFANNNMTGNGVARVISERGLQDRIMLTGYDSDPEQVAALRDGVIRALIVQDPFGMGYRGVMYAYDAIRGADLADFVDTGAVVVTSANVDDEDIQGLLDPTLKRIP